MEDNRKKLLDFVAHEDDLYPLKKWSREANIFDIFGIVRNEIRHSNILAWLFDPHGSHGCGDFFLHGILRKLSKRNRGLDSFSPEKWYSLNLSEAVIFREWSGSTKDRLDLLILFKSQKFYIAIENKVDSAESEDQTKKYRDTLKNQFPDFGSLLVLLSPDHLEATDQGGEWGILLYKDVLDVLKEMQDQCNLSPKVAYIIADYAYTLRRYFMNDEELVALCDEIYKRHKDALDLIFEYKTDEAKIIAKQLRDKIKNQSGWTNRESESKAVQFTTATMDEVLPPIKGYSGAWNNENQYYYQIELSNLKKISVKLVRSIHNLDDAQRNKQDEIIKRIPKYKDVSGKKFHAVKKEIYSMDDNLTLERNVVKLFEKIKNFVEKNIETNIKKNG